MVTVIFGGQKCIYVYLHPVLAYTGIRACILQNMQVLLEYSLALAKSDTFFQSPQHISDLQMAGIIRKYTDVYECDVTMQRF